MTDTNQLGVVIFVLDKFYQKSGDLTKCTASFMGQKKIFSKMLANTF